MDDLETVYCIRKSRFGLSSDQRWTMKYAQAGNGLAMYRVSSDYTYWHKRGADGRQAFYWLKKSADSGFAYACEILADIYRDGFIILHVLKGCETVERYPIGIDIEQATHYKNLAERIRKQERKPYPHVLSNPCFGWCTFMPVKGMNVTVSSIGGDFPSDVLTALTERIGRNIPLNIVADGEEDISLLVDSVSLLDSDTAFYIHKKRDGKSKPIVREISIDLLAIARQVVADIEDDYYGWVTFFWNNEFVKEERKLRKKVLSLKNAIAHYESTEIQS